MSTNVPEIYLVRHGQTEWSISRHHTGRTDIPLTVAGEEAARLLRPRLADIPFHAVLTSPSQRSDANVRASRLRRYPFCGSRSPRVGLQRVRGTDDQADPRQKAGMANVSRRLSRRRKLGRRLSES